jgi:hypothetical protein
MSYSFVLATTICDACHKSERNMVEVHWAAGNRHYCQQCWPDRRDFYENDSGRRAWKRLGNRYVAAE